jgi:hypothetical protein
LTIDAIPGTRSQNQSSSGHPDEQLQNPLCSVGWGKLAHPNIFGLRIIVIYRVNNYLKDVACFVLWFGWIHGRVGVQLLCSFTANLRLFPGGAGIYVMGVVFLR